MCGVRIARVFETPVRVRQEEQEEEEVEGSGAGVASPVASLDPLGSTLLARTGHSTRSGTGTCTSTTERHTRTSPLPPSHQST